MSKELVVTKRDAAAGKSSMASVKKRMQQLIVLLALAALPMLSQAKATAVSPFITVWDLTKSGSPVTGSTTQLSFGVVVSGSVSYSWRYVVSGLATTGSGTITSGSTTCTITGLNANATNFTLTIQPANFQCINIHNGTNKLRLVNISQWGSVAWTSMEFAFWGCANLGTITATDAPDLTVLTSLLCMFTDCANFSGSIGAWNTAHVTIMNEMFDGCAAFNQNIGSWNTANVTDMGFMFNNCTAFNQNISSWNTANVTDMSFMFSGCTAFNQNIGSWNTANVTNMSFMFFYTFAFNQYIGGWNVARVTDMSYMFFQAFGFDQSLANWTLKANVDLSFMLSSSGMSCASYSATLIGWAANPNTPTGIYLGASFCPYGTNAVAARNILINSKGWNFTNTGDIASSGSCYPVATWTGNNSNAWGTATNWNKGIVPTINNDVIIPAGTTNAPTVSSLQSINNLTVNTGATVSLGANLQVADALSNNGTITGSSALVLNGTANQTITGIGTVANLEVNKSGGTATITSGSSNKLNITGTLTFTAGNFSTNGNVVLKSTATGTARIAPITVAGPTRTAGPTMIISGNFTQERYIPAKTARTYTFVASPFRQTIAASWQQQVHITGPGTGGTVCPTLTANSNGFDATATNAASMFLYVGAKAVNTRWTTIDATSTLTNFPGTGYRMNIRGPRSTGCSLLDGTPSGLVPAAVTLSSAGTLDPGNRNMGSFTAYYANNGDASANNDNYLLVGNPYPSEISFSQLRANNSGSINNNYALFAPGNTVGNYAYWNGTTWTGGNTGLSNATGNIIANGQAFFVQGSIPGGDIALSFSENQKTTTANNGNFRQEQLNPDRVRIGYFLNNGDKADEIMLQFSQQGTVSALNAEDIVSMNNGTQTLQSVKGSRMMAINTRPFMQQDTIALNVTSTANGSFKLTFYDFDDMAHTDLYLMDRYTHTVQQMNSNKEYPFTVDKAIAATQGSQRFAVVFSRKVVPAITLVPNSSIRYYPNPVKDRLTVEIPASAGKTSIRLLDISGRALQQFTAKALQIVDMSPLSSGTYLLEVTNGKGEKTMEKIVKQ